MNEKNLRETRFSLKWEIFETKRQKCCFLSKKKKKKINGYTFEELYRYT